MLHVASWNVLAEPHFLKHRAHYPGVDVDAAAREKAVVGRLREETGRHDVIFLQEATPALVSALAAADLPFGWAPLGPGKPDGLAWWTRPGLPVFSTTVGALEGFGRACVTLSVRLPTACVALSCVHLQWSPEPAVQTGQVEALLAALEELPADVFVVLGDLNAPTDSPAVRALEAAGFADASTDRDAPTYMGYRTEAGAGPGWVPGRTDHALARGAALHSTVLGPLGPLPTLSWPSDHLLLSSRLLIEGP
jgi:endonuclease/exonuclease/phosphatase family metal-dependent hydrolase